MAASAVDIWIVTSCKHLSSSVLQFISVPCRCGGNRLTHRRNPTGRDVRRDAGSRGRDRSPEGAQGRRVQAAAPPGCHDVHLRGADSIWNRLHRQVSIGSCLAIPLYTVNYIIRVYLGFWVCDGHFIVTAIMKLTPW